MIKLRWYQQKCAPLVFRYWRQHPHKNPIIAIPTGAGKSLIIADIIHQAVSKWGIKVLVLSHRKEILSQNRDALQGYLNQMESNIQVGVYSAGLGERDIKQVTIAGIQSIHRKLNLFKDVKLIIIDEAHLISPTIKAETTYIKVLNELNHAKCIGLTATPYRLGTGYIVGDGHIFDDIIFDLTSKAQFNRLVKEGYLTNLIMKRTQIELNADTEGVRTVAGDWDNKELAQKFNKTDITKAAIKEIVEKGANYSRWLIFAIDINHAEAIAEELSEHGISAIPVHSKMEMDRGPILDAFRSGKIRALVNVNILTVGIDIPTIDLISLLRPTKSPNLYVQAAGRGLRVAEGKDHCLILDFARVVSTLGPINDVVVKKKKKGKKGEPIIKTCPECDTLHHPSVRICGVCGHKFEFKVNLNASSDGTSEIISTNETLWYKVDEVIYTKHEKQNAPRSMKVTYRCGLKTFNEWVCLEHKGYAKHKANYWANMRIGDKKFTDELNNVDSMLKISGDLKKPIKIEVKNNGKYPEITNYDFSAVRYS